MGDATIFSDADFAYLDPLGVVAYVPDTGVIAKTAAAIFTNTTFATVLLSNTFIFINLAIFTVSFAVYFSLRKY